MGKIVSDDEGLRAILTSAKTIAVVGLSRSPDKDSHRVAAYLLRQGYRIIPINPGSQEILGQRCYGDLAALESPPDIVDIFRPAAEVPLLVEQAIALGAKTVWMQLGIRHDQAAARAAEACLMVVMDRCMAIEHHRLMGERG